MDVLQFVDRIDPAAAVRLDLNDGQIWGLDIDGTDFSPPPLRRARASSLLADGERIPASAYDNRQLQLRLDLNAATVDDAAEQEHLLLRELDRANNILRWQPGTSRPVYFRAFRSPAGRISEYPGTGTFKTVDVTVEAEPFALAEAEMITAVNVSNDPAAANGCWFDVVNVKGDVETPLVMTRAVARCGRQSVLAVRRRGNPAATPFVLQAEAMTQGTDTSTQANDAAFSGAGNNYSRVATMTSAWATRLSANPWPAVASPDARGRYRVFARVRKNGTTGTVQARLAYGGAGSLVTGTAVNILGASMQMLDLGLLSIPVGADPIHDGPAGTELPARGIYIALETCRPTGTDTLDVDYLLLVAADDRLAMVNWSDAPGVADQFVADGIHDMAYGRIAASGEVVSMTPGWHVGGLPMLSPGANRVYLINEVKPGYADALWPDQYAIAGWYYPRYLHVRPAAS